jgi:hypothetical protein
MLDEKAAKRFWAKVRGFDSGNTWEGYCWDWMGSVSAAGYPIFSLRPGRQERAHRVSWVLHRGPIPEGPRVYVVRTCYNRLCVRPEHLALSDAPANGQYRSPK